MAMRRFMVQADEVLIERARRRAEDRGISLAQLVREAIESELTDLPPATGPELSFVGKYRSTDGRSARELTEAGRLPPRSWRS
jgi:hypothetical protein